MKKNVLALCDYQDPCNQNHTRNMRRCGFIQELLYWISYAVDTAATIAITGCTVFCCYLAWTML